MAEMRNYIRVSIILYNIIFLSQFSYCQSWRSNRSHRNRITEVADNPELYQINSEESPDEELSAKDLLIYVRDGRTKSQLPVLSKKRLEQLFKSVNQQSLYQDDANNYVESSRRSYQFPTNRQVLESLPEVKNGASRNNYKFQRAFMHDQLPRIVAPVSNEIKGNTNNEYHDYKFITKDLKDRYYTTLYTYLESIGDYYINATENNAKKAVIAYSNYAILCKKLLNLFKITYPDYTAPEELLTVIKEARDFYHHHKQSQQKENWKVDEIPEPKPIHQLLTIEEALSIYSLSKERFLELSQRYQSLKTKDNYTKLMRIYKILTIVYELFMKKFDKLKELERNSLVSKDMNDVITELYELSKWQYQYQELIFYETILQYLKTKDLNVRTSLDKMYSILARKYDNYRILRDYLLKNQPTEININSEYFPKMPQMFFGFFENIQQPPSIHEINVFSLQHDYLLMNYYEQLIKYLKSIHALRSNKGNAAKYNVINNYETLINLYETYYGLYVYLYGEGVIEKHENFPDPPNFFRNRLLQTSQTGPINDYKTQLNYTLPVEQVNPIKEFATASREFKDNLDEYIYILGKYFDTNNTLFDLLEIIYRKLRNSYTFYKYTYDQLPERIRMQQQIFNLPKFNIVKPAIIKIPSNVFKKPDIAQKDKKLEVLRTLETWKKQYDNDINKYIFIFELFNFPGRKQSKVLYDYGIQLNDDIKRIQKFYNDLGNVFIIHGLLEDKDIKVPQLLCKPAEGSKRSEESYELPKLLCEGNTKSEGKDLKEIKNPITLQFTRQTMTGKTTTPKVENRGKYVSERTNAENSLPEYPISVELKPDIFLHSDRKNLRKPSFEEVPLGTLTQGKITQSKLISIMPNQKKDIADHFIPLVPTSLNKLSMERTSKVSENLDKTMQEKNNQPRITPEKWTFEDYNPDRKDQKTMTKLSDLSKNTQINRQILEKLPMQSPNPRISQNRLIQHEVIRKQQIPENRIPVRENDQPRITPEKWTFEDYTPDRKDQKTMTKLSDIPKNTLINRQTLEKLPNQSPNPRISQNRLIQQEVIRKQQISENRIPVRVISENNKHLTRVTPEYMTPHRMPLGRVTPKIIFQKTTPEIIFPETGIRKIPANTRREMPDAKVLNQEIEISDGMIPERTVIEQLSKQRPHLRNMESKETILESVDREESNPQVNVMPVTPTLKGKTPDITSKEKINPKFFIQGNKMPRIVTTEKKFREMITLEKPIFLESIPQGTIDDSMTQNEYRQKNKPVERIPLVTPSPNILFKTLSIPERPVGLLELLTTEKTHVGTERLERQKIKSEKNIIETHNPGVLIPYRVNSEKITLYGNTNKKLQPDVQIQEKLIPETSQQRKITQKLPFTTGIPLTIPKPKVLIQGRPVQQLFAFENTPTESIMLRRTENPTPKISNPKIITPEQPSFIKLTGERTISKEIPSVLSSHPEQQTIHFGSNQTNEMLQKPILEKSNSETVPYLFTILPGRPTVKEYVPEKVIPSKKNQARIILDKMHTEVKEYVPEKVIPTKKNQARIILNKMHTESKQTEPASEDIDQISSTYLSNTNPKLVKTNDNLLKNYVKLYKLNKFNFNKLLEDYITLTKNYEKHLPDQMRNENYRKAFENYEKLKTLHNTYKTYFTYLQLKNQIGDHLQSVPNFNLKNQNYIDIKTINKDHTSADLLKCIYHYNQNLDQYDTDEYNFHEEVRLYNNGIKTYTDVLEKYKKLLNSYNSYISLHNCIYIDNHFPKKSGIYLPELPELYVIPPQLKKYFMELNDISLLPNDILKYTDDYIITFNNMNIHFLLYKDAYHEYRKNKNLQNYIKLIQAEKDYYKLYNEYSELGKQLVSMGVLHSDKFLEYSVLAPIQFSYLHPKLYSVYNEIKNKLRNETSYLEQKIYVYNILLKDFIKINSELELWYRKYKKSPLIHYYLYLIDLMKNIIELDKLKKDFKRNYKNIIDLPDISLSGRTLQNLKAPWLEGCFMANSTQQNSVTNQKLTEEYYRYIKKINEYYLLKSRYEAQRCEKPKELLFLNDRKIDPTYLSENIHQRQAIADKYYEIKLLYNFLRSKNLIRDGEKCDVIQINKSGVIKQQPGTNELKTSIKKYNEYTRLLSYYLQLYKLNSENFDKPTLNISVDELTSILEIIHNIHEEYLKLYIYLTEHNTDVGEIIRMPNFKVLWLHNSRINSENFIIRPDIYEPENFFADKISEHDVSNFIKYYILVKDIFKYYVSLKNLYADASRDILKIVSIGLGDLQTIENNLKFFYEKYNKYFTRLKELRVLPKGEEFIPFPHKKQQ